MKLLFRLIITFVLILGISAVVLNSTKVNRLITGRPEIFSKQNMLESLWYHYKKDYLEENTLRALDKQRDNITTSEGESYAMLQAVWMNDKETFDTSWQWTKDNLQHENDHLMSWLFGERADGSYGILTERGGHNAAIDADTDIALALLFASYRWNNAAYKHDALAIINDIWEKAVVEVNGKNYITASDAEKKGGAKTSYILNPSYFAPYAYRIFAAADPSHDWMSLVDSSYEILYANLDAPLDKSGSAFLPSDWVALDATTGALVPTGSKELTTDFAFDALRVPWRLALDYAWFKEPRAKEVLDKMEFLKKEYASKNKLARRYNHDGNVVEPEESVAMYGGTIGYFLISRQEEAKKVYLDKLEGLYNPDTFTWNNPLGYYDANWAWFGIALYNNLLPNLFVNSEIL